MSAWRYIRGGRKQTAAQQTWTRYEPDGNVWVDASPMPGHTYTRATWPPRGRGRGESLLSPRRVRAKLRAIEVIQLRNEGHTWDYIARVTGFRDASGPYRAAQRMTDRVDWDRRRQAELMK
jgi:hypothetical protein